MKIKTKRPLTPKQKAMRLLNAAYADLGEARFMLDTQIHPSDRQLVFRLLAGVVANCEIVKLSLRR